MKKHSNFRFKVLATIGAMSILILIVISFLGYAIAIFTSPLVIVFLLCAIALGILVVYRKSEHKFTPRPKYEAIGLPGRIVNGEQFASPPYIPTVEVVRQRPGWHLRMTSTKSPLKAGYRIKNKPMAKI